MKDYMIQLTSPATPPNHFTLHIFPSDGGATIVRQAHFTDEDTVRVLLTKCLPKDIIVDKVISEARDGGVCSLYERAIPLSDECAKELGWIF
jgi:hypothetical protein